MKFCHQEIFLVYIYYIKQPK